MKEPYAALTVRLHKGLYVATDKRIAGCMYKRYKELAIQPIPCVCIPLAVQRYGRSANGMAVQMTGQRINVLINPLYN
jgi:hypothetical protein